MAVQISMPKKKQDDGGLSDLMAVGNTAMGVMTGNPLQAMQGISSLSKEKEVEPTEPLKANAFSRRMGKIKGGY